MSKKSLGDTLRRARQQQGLGVRQLARLVEVAPSQVARWESNELTPTGPKLVALAQQLELRASELFTLAGRPIPEDRASLPAMLRADYELPPSAIAEIESYIAEVAKRYPTDQSAKTSKSQKGRRET
jgi:transcriptional regulator with XRE-family HTH domain